MNQTSNIKLHVQDLHKSYGSHEVLKGVSLTAHAGDVISIIGSSGSGKSTFLRCINMLEQPNSGSIAVTGEQLALTTDKRNGALKAADAKQLARIRTKLAMVFQHFNLWAHMTVLENIIEAPVHVLGVPKDEAIARARKYLDKVGLKGVEDKYPSHMSGGQQQRVAIARALAMSPKVLLCDEITSALDPELVNEVLAVVRQLAAEGMTLIMVTHEMRFAREVSDKLVFMHEGRVHECGHPEQLFSQPATPELANFIGAVC